MFVGVPRCPVQTLGTRLFDHVACIIEVDRHVCVSSVSSVVVVLPARVLLCERREITCRWLGHVSAESARPTDKKELPIFYLVRLSVELVAQGSAKTRAWNVLRTPNLLPETARRPNVLWSFERLIVCR